MWPQYSDIGGLDKQIQEVIALYHCDCKISTIADTFRAERKEIKIKIAFNVIVNRSCCATDDT